MTPRALLRAAIRVTGAGLIAVALSWAVAASSPGGLAGAAARAEGRAAATPDVDPAAAAALRREVAHRRGVDRPLAQVIAGATLRALRLDLGASWRSGSSVTATVSGALPRTLAMAAAALALGLIAGIAGALASGQSSAGSARTRLLGALTALALATPPVWIGLALIALTGGVALTGILAIASLIPVVFAVVHHQLAAALRDYARSPAYVAARARGLSERSILRRHGLRAAVTTLAPLTTSLIAYLVGATVVTDRLFDIRGLGYLLVDAARHGDVPLLVGVVATFAVVVALASVAADRLAARLDPRLEPA